MPIRYIAVLIAALLCAAPALAQPPEQIGTEDPRRSEYLTPGLPDSPVQTRQFWATADYLLGFTQASDIPILATTSVAGTPRLQAGVLGRATTAELFSGALNDEPRSGIRLGGGWWFGGERNLGLEAGLMVLESQTTIFSSDSGTNPILARPYTNARDNTQQSVLVAFPGSSTGSLDIRVHSGNFYSAHVGFAEKAIDNGWFRLNALFGYRYYQFDEGLEFRQLVAPTGANFIRGTLITTNDSFTTRNDFHGCDMGFRGQFLWGDFTLELLTKLAIGRVHREVTIAGDQTIMVPGAAPIFQVGGVHALSSNIGFFPSNDWKVMPEAGATLAWQVRPYVTVRVGYSFLLLHGIARAADQIDPVLNPNLFPPENAAAANGPPRPAFGLRRTEMWMQTLNLGIEFTY